MFINCSYKNLVSLVINTAVIRLHEDVSYVFFISLIVLHIKNVSCISYRNKSDVSVLYVPC
jgi:hypothetical protein